MDKKVIPIVLAKPETPSDAELLELFQRTKSVLLYTTEFNEIISKLFPEDKELQGSIAKSYKNTVRRLESVWRIHTGALTPEFILASMSKKNGGIEIQRVALRASAAKNLFTRCKQCEQDMTVLE